jgi:dolichol-phosphate mannosyltransferase
MKKISTNNSLKLSITVIFYLIILTLSFYINSFLVVENLDFKKYQTDSESFVIGKILNDKYYPDNSLHYGLGRDSRNYYSEDFLSINDEKLYQKFDLYKSQVGLQGHFFSFLYNKLGLNLSAMHLLVAILSALSVIIVSILFAKIINVEFGFIFFVSIFLSPWTTMIAKNLYWVIFAWFLPAIFSFLTLINIDNSKKYIFLLGFFIAVFVKCLCGYEYLSTILLFASSVFIISPFLEKNSISFLRSFKYLMILFFISILAFILSYLFHANIRGDGNILSGIKLIFNEDVKRRIGGTFIECKYYSNQLIETMGILDVIYFDVFNRIIIPYFLFKVDKDYLILIIFYNIIILSIYPKSINKKLNIVIFCTFLITSISWYIIAHPHTLCHIHLNQNLWYFGFAGCLLYIPYSYFKLIFQDFIFKKKLIKKPINDLLQIPKFETHIFKHNSKNNFKDKLSKYCVIIPVINEGEKIQSQLKAMIEISKKIDVIIADGGTTDNSLNQSFLANCWVKTLMIINDKAGLSSQLRMAFHYAINQGYQGFITIDGNGKDSIENIFDFVEKLDEGYDFVQGSRFIKGGKAINTPMIRYLAIKFIHVPLISYIAKFNFSDTTNGFRAYSKKYLTCKDVKIFRDIFSSYELLGYLSVRASQLKMKVCEIPVTRKYPKGKKIPTKISFFKGNFLLIMVIFKLLLGRFNP